MATTVELELDLGFLDVAHEDDDWFDTLVTLNQRWLSSYARLHPSFGVSLSLLQRNSLWMNTYFQKQRMITPPDSKQAKTLLAQHQKTVLDRLRAGGSGGVAQCEIEHSTALVDPMTALMFAASGDRCPEQQIELLLTEALELVKSRPLRIQALNFGFAGCVFRFLTAYTEPSKRILTLQLLVLLATDDAAAVVQSCKVAAQGQFWQPIMFIYTLQKRHSDNAMICDVAAQLLTLFTGDMPIASPIKIDSARHGEEKRDDSRLEKAGGWTSPPSRSKGSPASRSGTHTLPALGSTTTTKGRPGMAMSPHRPTTTISSLYIHSPSPYSPSVILPIARPPPSAAEQTRRSLIYSTPKETAVAGDLTRRCRTPNIVDIKRTPSALTSADLDWMENASPPKSPLSPRGVEKKPIVLSEKYSWHPDSITSVSGFEWWWRSLPPHHTNLEPTQKLKMVTKAAVRLHTNGEWERAIELYLLALSMDVNDEVAFRLHVNLGCAYEIGKAFTASEVTFRAALQINSSDPYARFKLGAALKELGRFDEAIVAFEAVQEAYPQAKLALQQVEEARQEKLQQTESERATLAIARTARPPSKPGRRLHSRGHNAITSLPRLAKPASPAASPRPQNENVSSLEDIMDISVGPVGLSDRMELVPWIRAKTNETKVDLRAALQAIDADATGCIRQSALVTLLAALGGVEEMTILNWLPHTAVHVDPIGVVRYDTLLDALDPDAKRTSARDPDQASRWRSVVERIKQQEASFYDSVKAKDESQDTIGKGDDDQLQQPPAMKASTNFELISTGEGPSDLEISGEVPAIPGSSATEVPTQPPIEDLDEHPTAQERLTAKRVKARQEMILRAERARIVARKHLHCAKALQDIAARARRYLTEQYEALESQPTLIECADPSAPSHTYGDDEHHLVPTAPSVHAVNEDHEVPLDTVTLKEADSSEWESDRPVDDHAESQADEQTHDYSSVHNQPLQKDSDRPSATATAALSTVVVETAVAAATRRIVVASSLAELQAVASAFTRIVPETLAHLTAHVIAAARVTHLLDDDGTASMEK